MRKPEHKIILCLFFLLKIYLNFSFAEEYWQQFVHYSIDATLDTATHSIRAQEVLRYQNNSPDTLSELYFHLYPNAFQNESIMAKEINAASLNLIRSEADKGWIKLDSLAIHKTKPGQENVKIDAHIDDTILKVKISPSIFRGEEIIISITFRTKIRQINFAGGKGGYLGSHYEISQWYPKICVYDQNGWNATYYHWLGEFYGEFGTFDVTLNVPGNYIVAATGEVVSGDPGWESVKVDSSGQRQLPMNYPVTPESNSTRRVVTFHAENVHDFVWLASPDYWYQTDFYSETPIHILYLKNAHKSWRNSIRETKLALDWLDELVGKYPYPALTICQSLTPGGMEYPTVAILGYFDSVLLEHEIGHMYFYAAVANNEHADGWLDEGLITYQSELFTSRHFPERNRNITPSIEIGFLRNQFDSCTPAALQLNSLYNYFYSGFDKPLATECSQLKNLYLYSYNVYVKPSRFFRMLNYLVGHDTFVKILQAYYQQWKFKHVNGNRFQDVCEQVSHQDLDWFFKQWVSSTTKIDYACSDMVSQKHAAGAWKTDISIARLGKGVMPVDAEITTVSGERLRQRWDGKNDRTVLSFQTNEKIKEVQLDPDDIILDQNRLNNSTFRIKSYLYPDFPSMYYLSRDAYSLFFWQRAWYNDVDGFKLGLNILGSYLNRYSVTRNYFWYGFKSHQVDFNLGYSTPWERINKNLWRHVNVLKTEGRQEINVNLNYNIFEEFASQKTHSFRLGFSHQSVFDDDYIYRRIKQDQRIIKIQDWEQGDLNKFYFMVQSNCWRLLPQSTVEFTGQVSNPAWKSDFDYIRFSLESKFQLGKQTKDWRITVRNFIGYAHATESHVPIQDRFWGAEGNPGQRFRYFYLSSPGAMPTQIYYHFPGDGNLRGYLNKLVAENSPLAADRIITANVEFVQRNLHLLLPQKIEKLFQGINFALFADAGYVGHPALDQDLLFDAGIGLRFYKKFLGKQKLLRLDFPLWLSHPNIDNQTPNESPLKFRWIVSFQ